MSNALLFNSKNMKNKIYLFCLIVLGCGRFSNSEDYSPEGKRIVCISKQYTEIIFALGAEKNIVAVDVSSTYPQAAKKLPTVGYHRALSAEGVLANEPDLILHDDNIGPEHVVKQLQELEIPMKVFDTKAEDIESTKKLIQEMGIYFHQEKKAKDLCEKLDKDMKKALANTQKFKRKTKVLIIHYGQASNVYLVMTKKSTAAKMIEWSGGVMAIDDEKGMRHLSPEVVADSDPDVILLTDFGYDRLQGSSEKISDLPGVSSTRAYQNNRIYRIEEHDVVYFGPRTGENILMLQELIHRDETEE